jgi:hypothetical protein
MNALSNQAFNNSEYGKDINNCEGIGLCSH